MTRTSHPIADKNYLKETSDTASAAPLGHLQRRMHRRYAVFLTILLQPRKVSRGQEDVAFLAWAM